MNSNFIHLASGYAINPDAISHIDFRRPAVMVHLGQNSVEATGADAAMLRDMFEPKPEAAGAAPGPAEGN